MAAQLKAKQDAAKGIGKKAAPEAKKPKVEEEIAEAPVVGEAIVDDVVVDEAVVEDVVAEDVAVEEPQLEEVEVEASQDEEDVVVAEGLPEEIETDEAEEAEEEEEETDAVGMTLAERSVEQAKEKKAEKARLAAERKAEMAARIAAKQKAAAKKQEEVGSAEAVSADTAKPKKTAPSGKKPSLKEAMATRARADLAKKAKMAKMRKAMREGKSIDDLLRDGVGDDSAEKKPKRNVVLKSRKRKISKKGSADQPVVDEAEELRRQESRAEAERSALEAQEAADRAAAAARARIEQENAARGVGSIGNTIEETVTTAPEGAVEMPVSQEFRFRCSGCGQKLKAMMEWIGRNVECPGCRTMVLIPDPNVPAETYEPAAVEQAPNAPRATGPFVFECPACKQQLTGQPEHVGVEMECPTCNNVLVVPDVV